MCQKNNPYHSHTCSRILIGLLILASNGAFAVGQEPGKAASDNQQMKDLRVVPGKVLVEGRNDIPTGPLGLLTYRIEEVALPQAVEISRFGKKESFNTAIRLTITGKSVWAASVIWVGDARLIGVWSHGPGKIGALIYDRSIFEDGAVVSVQDDKGMYDLPERLKLPQSFRATLKPEVIEEGNGIVRITSVLRIAGSERLRLVAIEMRTAKPLPITNLGYSVQIGRRFFDAGGGGTNWSVQLTERQFAELKDGDRVAIGVGAFNIAYLGRLDKSIIDR